MSFFIILQQVLVLFLLIGVGYLAGRLKMIGAEAVRDMTKVLINIVSPCVVIDAFQVKYTPALVHGLLISAASAAGAHIFSILLGTLIFNKKWPEKYRYVLRFVTTYTNSGFVGIPLIQAIVGTKGIIYGSTYIAVFNLFVWTHGILVYQQAGMQKNRLHLRAVLKSFANPNIFAILIGILLFAFSVHLPFVLSSGLGFIYNLNTPLSMLIIGATMRDIDFKSLFTEFYVWPGVLMRNFAVPMLYMIFLFLVGIKGTLFTSCILQVACPAAGYTVLFAEKYGVDTAFPSKLMTLSTLMSVVSVPLLLSLHSLLPT